VDDGERPAGDRVRIFYAFWGICTRCCRGGGRLDGVLRVVGACAEQLRNVRAVVGADEFGSEHAGARDEFATPKPDTLGGNDRPERAPRRETATPAR
jgi:hypothetical protein